MTRSTISLVFVLTVLACAPFAYPQTFPVAEGYLGFTVLNNEYGTDRQNSPGVQFGFGYNLHRNLRLIADFGAETHDTKIVWTNGRKASADSYQLLFGPELTIRSKPNVTPFFHGLVGVAFRNYAVPTGNWVCSIYSCYETSFNIARDTGLATGIGGGIDWHFHSVMSFRVVQFDWVRSHLTRDNANFNPIQGQLPTLRGWQDNYRFSVGIVFRFGEKGGSR
jgi:hypothetical protein